MAVKPEHELEFLDLAAEVAKHVHDAESGTMLYVLTKHPTDPHTYLWLERYRDQAALHTHSEAPYLVAALQMLPGLLSAPPQLLELAQVLPQ